MTEEDKERYHKALHAMQTGVATMMNIDPHDLSAKHTRVGINSALCDNSALGMLLVKKGIITEDELDKALADEMEAEVERYKKRIEEHIGHEVNLA